MPNRMSSPRVQYGGFENLLTKFFAAEAEQELRYARVEQGLLPGGGEDFLHPDLPSH